MSNSTELNSYIVRLRQRLRLGAWLRGAAIFCSTALTITVVLVLVLNHFAFPAHGVGAARLVMILTLAAAAVLGLAMPLLRLTSATTVRRVEAANPELEQRLTTFEERAATGDDPFLELLAADTLKRTEHAPPQTLVPDNRLFAFGGAGLGCAAVLVWMIGGGPGFLGYGASLLWTGPKKDAAPLYAIAVKPGNITVRRNSDQLVVAHVTGMQPGRAQLFAHYQSEPGWETVNMQSAPDAGGGASYQFTLAGLPENVEYYVSAGPLTSAHYKVRVVDLPSVKAIHVVYHYPKWTGLKSVAEDHSGDLRAIEGTDASLEIQTDRPLKDGMLALDGGQTIKLSGGQGNTYQGTIHMEKDGAYHVAAIDEGEPVRLSEDYFIATDKAQPPEVSIDRPTGDYRASPIEEVTVGVKAADEFGLKDVHLHYSVNGGTDHDISLLKDPGAKQADGKYMLPLEDFHLVPGDVVSVYASAKDGHSENHTDISFIQVDPFEREFSQSQQSGGGGGGGGGGNGNDQTEISKREKELIAATWKQQNDKTATPKDEATQGQFLSDAQQKLRDQVNALSVRMQSRDISQANQEFNDFDKDMQTAAAAMGPSADKLKGMQWKDAIPQEQKALQALLRAEATFRQIEVAFGQRGGGGGGGGSTGRDLASLFDLELDTQKNQYESAQTASPAEQHQKDVEDALQKLDALAKRQEDLANQPNNPQQSFQERWQQEMLRREAEELERQMQQQLAQANQQNGAQSQNGGSNSQQQQGGQQQSSSQQSGQQSASGASGSSSGQAGGQPSASAQGGAQAAGGAMGQRGTQSSRGQSGQQSGTQGESAEQRANDQRVQEAMSRLQQATEMMHRNDASPQQSAEDARAAAERLRQAANLLAGTQQKLANGRLDTMANEAGKLTDEERSQEARINKLANAGQQGSSASTDSSSTDLSSVMARLHERDQLAADRQQLSDDLSKLQGDMRNAAHDMAPDQPDVAKKLRDALSQMDESDLTNYVQRTADWLRRGINPNSNGTEGQIAQGLSKLSQELGQAQKTMAQEKSGDRGPGQGPGDETAAINQVERLRGELEAMAGAQGRNNREGRNGNEAQGGNEGQQAGGLSRDGREGNGNGRQPGSSLRDGQPGVNGQSARNGQHGQQGGWSMNPQQLSRNGQAGGNSTGGNGAQFGGIGVNQARGAAGNLRGGASGDTRAGGGPADGTVWGNYDTGNNTPQFRGQHQPAPADASGNPADSERTIEQGLRQLRELRQMVEGDPQAAKDVEELTRKMQNLDPGRFRGNPAMVEAMHSEIMSSVDRLELELQRNGAATDARIGKPDAVPAGYQESVADYYRRLSQNGR